MSEKDIEMMKRLIEEKRLKGLKKGVTQRAEKTTGEYRKANRSTKKTGGLFDK